MSDAAGSDPRPEFAFINWVSRQCSLRPEVLLGIGDDAAVLKANGQAWVCTQDLLTAGVHFDPNAPAELIGRKALAVNLSDIAAMAAKPCAAFVGVVFPRTMQRGSAERLYRGLLELADEFHVSIAGGDTNSWDGPLVISVTLLGLAAPAGVVRRDGARPGDWIFVTGALGGSLPSGRHLTFPPRVNEALHLHQEAELHAMLDISDGLGSDLFHILDSSRVGAKLDGAAIPIHDDVDLSLPSPERLQRALCDGEDFELLFTVSPEDGERLLRRSPVEVPLSRIGEITCQLGARIDTGGTVQELPRAGWVHDFGR